MMELIKVNQELCLHDGICARECPLELISMNESSKLPEYVNGVEARCIKCGHCVAICSQGALSIEGIRAEDCAIVEGGSHPSDLQVEHLIKVRRSVRNFKNKSIDHEILLKLFGIACYAPTGGNSQQVQWLVYDNPEAVNKLASKVIDFFRDISNSGHPLSERYNITSLIKRWEKGKDVIFQGAPALVLVHSPKKYGLSTVDNTIALSYFDLAASNLGLGTCWAGFFMVAASQSPEVIKYLDLPEGNMCTGALMIGYPKSKYVRIPVRKDPQVIWRS